MDGAVSAFEEPRRIFVGYESELILLRGLGAERKLHVEFAVSRFETDLVFFEVSNQGDLLTHDHENDPNMNVRSKYVFADR